MNLLGNAVVKAGGGLYVANLGQKQETISTGASREATAFAQGCGTVARKLAGINCNSGQCKARPPTPLPPSHYACKVSKRPHLSQDQYCPLGRVKLAEEPRLS